MDQRTTVILLAAIADTLRELKEAPAGTLYAALAGRVDLGDFNRLVDGLVHLGIAKRGQGHLLTFTQPDPDTPGARFLAAIAATTAPAA